MIHSINRICSFGYTTYISISPLHFFNILFRMGSIKSNLSEYLMATTPTPFFWSEQSDPVQDHALHLAAKTSSTFLLIFVVLMCLEIIGLLFCRMFLSLGLSDGLKLKLRLYTFGRNNTDIMLTRILSVSINCSCPISDEQLLKAVAAWCLH